ncbi:MAG TPA: prephenate dehydrogenase/arogenate dehydrogenase family protein [Bryobacteraceae bacterium]|jgi:prephenate dehydrogenase|nr:prephenate dehydrogenase/arogenate dehydrogenase family protein [Bryobacteraceae bacterium]
MRKIAIAGVGLIGASFGLALRKAGFTGAIVGVSSPRSIEAAIKRGAIDSGAPLEQAAAQADLIFLSQPISGILETLKHLDPLVKPGALVTDAGSTKGAICDTAAAHLYRATFVGGHPMAGKEQRGAEAADADLFRGRPWILTNSTAAEFRGWLEKIGAQIRILDAATHDRLVAWSSHLPQLASTALAAAIQNQQPGATAVAGPGLVDMTRLALSSYDLWRDILDTNQTEVAAALDAYIAKLQTLRGHFEKEFSAGAELARALRKI